MVPRDGHDRRAKAAQKGGGAVVLGGPPAVRQVAGGDDQLGLCPRHERPDRLVNRGVVTRPEMEIR